MSKNTNKLHDLRFSWHRLAVHAYQTLAEARTTSPR